jgi:hypothetical protein
MMRRRRRRRVVMMMMMMMMMMMQLLRTRKCVGLARTIYIRCIYDIFGREITKYTVIYSVLYGSGQL